MNAYFSINLPAFCPFSLSRNKSWKKQIQLINFIVSTCPTHQTHIAQFKAKAATNRPPLGWSLPRKTPLI